MSDTTVNDRYPADRYPEASGPSRRTLRWILPVIGVLVAVILTFVLYQRFGAKDIESDVISFDVVDNSTIDMQFKVTREDPSQAAVCIIRARSKDGSETGRREVLIPPSESGTVVMNSTVKTSQRPGMGDIYGCGFVVPEYLRAP